MKTVKTRYVLGFLFSPDLETVVLIEKKRPEWQNGKLNGVGGKVELGEFSHQAMSREFQEEAGLRIPEEQWILFSILEGEDFRVDCFYATSENFNKAVTMTDERILFKQTPLKDNFPSPISNLPWLVSIVLDPDHPRFIPVRVNYS